MTTYWPTLKRGNPYRHEFAFSFASGSITDCEAVLMIKDSPRDADADALLVVVSDATSDLIDELDAIVGLTVSAGASPNTGVIAIDIPAASTATLPSGRPYIGLQLTLPNGDPLEFEKELLDDRILVEGHVVYTAGP
jgi:hypothetical protein